MNFIEINSQNELYKLNYKIDLNNYDLKINIKTNIENVLFNFLKNKQNVKYYFKNNKIKYIDITKNENLYLFFIDVVNYSNYIIRKKNNFIKNDNLWNICIYDDMMFNLPFTLEDIIFIPFNFIKNCYKNKDKLQFSETLIHEKIHISQRDNNKLWDDYILNYDKNWIKITSDNDLFLNIKNAINNYDKNIVIYNPDTFYDFLYVYKINNKIFLGLLILKNNYNIKTKWFEYDLNLKILIPQDKNIFNEEHPYEQLAYSLSKEMIKNS